jgi:hypothetical protein
LEQLSVSKKKPITLIFKIKKALGGAVDKMGKELRSLPILSL